MQVQVTIEPAQMGETVLEMFNSLTTEDRRGLMLDIMREWFRTPINYEAAANYDRLITEIRQGKWRDNIDWSDRDKIKDMTDAEMQTKYWFTKLAETHIRSTREIMVHTVIEEAKKVFAESVKEMVLNDPEIQDLKTKTCAEIGKMFPLAAHDAIVVFVGSFLGTVGQQASQAMMQTNFLTDQMRNLTQRITGQY